MPAPEPASKVQAEEDPAPELQYQVATGWMRRGDTQKARQAFQEVVQRYPASRFARQARAQLERLPAQAAPATASAVTNPNAPHTPSRDEAIAQWRTRYEAESQAGRPHTITEEDIRGISKSSGRAKPVEPSARRVSIANSEPPTSGSGDQLSLTSAHIEGDMATLQVNYRLGGTHARAVYAGARVMFPNAGYFSYGAEALTPGAGETVITVRVGSENRPTSVRLMFFESQGVMFFSREVPWP